MTKEFSVMFEPVHADLEARFDELPHKSQRGGIVLGHEIEGRTEMPFFLQIHEPGATPETRQAINVVLEDKGELLLVGPAGPAFGMVRGARVDRPYIRMCLSFFCRDHLPEPDLQPPGDARLDLVIKIYGLHVFKPLNSMLP